MNEMKNIVKSCDLPGKVAAKLFAMLNDGVAVNRHHDGGHYVIVTDRDPNTLTYPEGWYFLNGMFRNKHNSTKGDYSEISVVNSFGESW